MKMDKANSRYFTTARRMDLALITLLKKKSFEYITVSELCKEAGVNRTTFYLHYETLTDLLCETTQCLLDDFLAYFTQDKTNMKIDLHTCSLKELNFICDEYIIPYLTYIKEHKEVFAVAMNNLKLFGFDDVYARLFVHILNPVLERFHYPESDRKYVMMYYLNGLNAISQQWLIDGCEKPIADIARIIRECVFGRAPYMKLEI